MKICPNCEGSGHFFEGINPLRWSTCIVCKGRKVIGKIFAPETIKIHTIGNLTSSNCFIFSLDDFSDIKNPTLAHVMFRTGVFPSVSQARKNGWNKPLVRGHWTLTKRKIRVTVV